MKRSRSLAAFAILAAALCGAAIGPWPAPERIVPASSTDPSDPSAREVASARGSGDTHARPAESGASNAARDPAPARRASSAAESAAILDAIAAGDVRAIERRIDLAATCRPFAGARPPPLPDTGLTRRIRAYCADYVDLVDQPAFESAMADREAGVLATVDVLRATRAGRGDEALAAEVARLLDAGNASEMAAVLHYASESRIQLPGIPDERFANPLLDWSAVYEVAGLLSHCGDNADCGPSGLYTYFGCVAWQLCDEGTTYREQVRALAQPIVFAEAESLLGRIRRDAGRHDGNGGR